MEILNRAPQFLLERIPEGMRGLFQGTAWQVMLGVGALLIALVLWRVLRRTSGGEAEADGTRIVSPLEVEVADIPAAAASTGDRQLRVEGVPVRLRLVAVAPAGHADEVNEGMIAKMLDQVVPGLGDIFRADRPEVRIWPVQLSYQGFATHFHRNTVLPEAEGEPTPWVVLAGRVKLGKQQVMLGMALVAVKPTTVGRRTLDSHEWAAVMRVRVRD